MSFLTSLYASVTKSERKFFDCFDFLKFSPEAKLISVGNLSTGGTGKTPLLLALLKETAGRKRLVLTRGYRSNYERSYYELLSDDNLVEGLTDESILMHKHFPDVPILIGKNRAHSAKMAQIKFKPELIFLDDGFQYRRLMPDLNIVLWDATISDKYARLLPYGRLREPMERLKEADVLMLTSCESVSSEKIEAEKRRLREYASDIPIIKVMTKTEGVYNGKGEALEEFADKKFLALSAIGNPKSFYAQLASLGIEPKIPVELRDHHAYTKEEIEAFGQYCREEGLKMICTEKDLVKIPEKLRLKYDIHHLKIVFAPLSGLTFTEELEKAGIRM